LVDGFALEMPSRRTNNFPESGHGLGHVTPAIFGSTVGYPSDSLASCSFCCHLGQLSRKLLIATGKRLSFIQRLSVAIISEVT